MQINVPVQGHSATVKNLAKHLIVSVNFSGRFSIQTLFCTWWLPSTSNQVVQSSLLSWWIAIWDPISPALIKSPSLANVKLASPKTWLVVWPTFTARRLSTVTSVVITFCWNLHDQCLLQRFPNLACHGYTIPPSLAEPSRSFVTVEGIHLSRPFDRRKRHTIVAWMYFPMERLWCRLFASWRRSNQPSIDHCMMPRSLTHTGWESLLTVACKRRDEETICQGRRWVLINCHLIDVHF